MHYSFAIPILRNLHIVTALFSLFRKPYIPALSCICFWRMFTDFSFVTSAAHMHSPVYTHGHKLCPRGNIYNDLLLSVFHSWFSPSSD